MTAMTEYRIYRCPSGHSWDVFGRWADGPPPFPALNRTFVPEDMKLVNCPTCDQTAEDLDGDPPENLTGDSDSA